MRSDPDPCDQELSSSMSFLNAPTTTLAMRPELAVLVLLATIVGAPRPGTLVDDHAILQAQEESSDRYSVHAGGHFSRDHHRHGAKEQKMHSTESVAMAGAQRDWAKSVSLLEKPTQESTPPKKVNGTVLDANYPGIAQPKCGEVYGGAPTTSTCPKECGYTAEMDNSADEKMECHFKCVTDKQCGSEGTQKTYTIADSRSDENLCRHCEVEGCLTCTVSAPGQDTEAKEMCTTCMPGYYKVNLGKNGLAGGCRSFTIWIFLALAVFAALGVVGGLAWYLELVNRPVVNQESLDYGLACRSRSKLRQPANTELTDDPEVGPQLLYPFWTNLCSTNVAGPGNMLFFRFQAATLIWAIVLLSVWCAMVCYIDTDLFMLGLKQAKTPQQMCYVVKMGRKMQLKYVWVKVYWLVFAYTFSFLGAICYGVNSLRLFRTLDSDHTTMGDYVALCRSVPKMKGDQAVEDCIKECIEKETGEKVVGVSVCWNFHSKLREVKAALEDDVGSLEHAKATNAGRFGRGEDSPPDEAAGIEHSDEDRPGVFESCMDWINNQTLAKWHCHFHEHVEGAASEQEDKGPAIAEMLRDMECTEMAFAVFPTEDSRDKALAAVKGRPVPLGESEGFFLEYEDHEPESCCWEDFSVTEKEIAVRLSAGAFKMCVAVACWTFLLYVPYSHYMGSFSYANGDEPGEMSEGIFVGLVVGAQIGLFVVASQAAHHAGFCFEDDKQRMYILLYNSALIVNLVLDMSLTAYLAYHQMCGRGVRTADGRLLSEINSFQKIIESYPMQKAVGNNLFKYCWPATFFVPFFAEPFAAQIGPYLVGRSLVRSNKKMTGENAEKALELSEAEQGRYADVMFNAILVCAVPMIAPAYMWKTFGALIFSHIFIYSYDHWRVLRCCTRFYFASDTVNAFSQKIFAVPCGMLATGIVFKGNQMLGAETSTALGAGPLKGIQLASAMAGAFFIHFFLHLAVLDYVVPALAGDAQTKNAEEPYEVTAKTTACTWFSSNPIHCLRSKYILKHDPPQTFFVLGKEHMQKSNPKINAYYEEEASKIQEGTLGL